VSRRERIRKMLLVEPGTPAGLAQRDPDWKGGDEFGQLSEERLTSTARKTLETGVKELSDAQELLWASDTHALLVDHCHLDDVGAVVRHPCGSQAGDAGDRCTRPRRDDPGSRPVLARGVGQGPDRERERSTVARCRGGLGVPGSRSPQHQPSQGRRFQVVPSYATLTIQDPVVKSCGDARVSRRCARVMTGSSVSVSPPVTV
jgi:hypothetical protein